VDSGTVESPFARQQRSNFYGNQAWLELSAVLIATEPLHAGYASDKGGNTFQVQAFGKGTNLHALWDSGLVWNWPDGAAIEHLVHCCQGNDRPE
jgi:hypothetical protein